MSREAAYGRTLERSFAGCACTEKSDRQGLRQRCVGWQNWNVLNLHPVMARNSCVWSNDQMGEQFAHSVDFRSVTWFGRVYSFTANQAAIVKVLWDNWKRGTSEVGNAALLDAADCNQNRLDLVFRGCPAWGTMIQQGKTKGTSRLVEHSALAKPFPVKKKKASSAKKRGFANVWRHRRRYIQGWISTMPVSCRLGRWPGDSASRQLGSAPKPMLGACAMPARGQAVSLRSR